MTCTQRPFRRAQWQQWTLLSPGEVAGSLYLFIFLDADTKAVSSPRGNSEACSAKGNWAQHLEKERKGRKKVIQEILDMFAFTGRQLFEYILQEFFFFLVAFSEVVLVIKMLT